MSDFWSRRRAAVEAEEHAAAEAARRAAEAEARAEIEALDEDAQLEALGLPVPETLEPWDDFTAFMRREVPQALRRRALRVLWRSNPVLANLDGLVDHGEDFTDAATVRAGMKTSYEVGHGLAAHIAHLAAHQNDETAPQEPPAPEPATPIAADEAPAADMPDVEPPDLPAVAQADAPLDKMTQGQTYSDDTPAPPMRPRLMRFRFGNDAGGDVSQGRIAGE